MSRRLLTQHIQKGCVFSPDDDPDAINLLVEEVAATREATLAALALRLTEDGVTSASVVQFLAAVKEFTQLSVIQRRQLMAYPPVFIWLRKAIRQSHAASQPDFDSREFDSTLCEFRSLCARATASQTDRDRLRVASCIPVHRFDVDQLVAAAAPPTYTFPSSELVESIDAENAYTLSFFTQVANVALDRIAAAWPRTRRLFPMFVQMIVHIPDGAFRSVSAERYTGVVFLSADDDNLLDLEESLVHEFGHQVLYQLMEVDPVVQADPDLRFVLPWSGTEREFYGYFHAFYIYFLLARYYERVISAGRDENQAQKRLTEIVEGLKAALPDFAEDASLYTPLGRIFCDSLCSRVNSLVEVHQKYACFR